MACITRLGSTVLVVGLLSIAVVAGSISDAFGQSLEVTTDKKSYEYGEHLAIIIKVSEVTNEFAHVSIRDQDGKESSLAPLPIKHNKTKIESPRPFTADIFKPGLYYIDVRYGQLNATASFRLTQSDKISIPLEVKTILSMWADGLATDSNFATQIRYLESQNVVPGMNIGDKQHAINKTKVTIPAWLQENIEWWEKDLVSDTEFGNAIKYLVNNHILKI